MLELRNITKVYPGPQGQVRAVDGVSFTLQRGEFAALQGPSGSGKSTILLIAGGLLTPDQGVAALAGSDLYSLSPARRAALRAERIGFVFQQFHLVPYLSVMDNVLAPSLAAAVPDARARARELVERFGLGARSHHVPAQLSVGERQRTALARAMLNRPALILADEPTANVDHANQHQIMELIRETCRDEHVALVLVTHTPEVATQFERVDRLEEINHAGRDA